MKNWVCFVLSLKKSMQKSRQSTWHQHLICLFFISLSCRSWNQQNSSSTRQISQIRQMQKQLSHSFSRSQAPESCSTTLHFQTSISPWFRLISGKWCHSEPETRILCVFKLFKLQKILYLAIRVLELIGEPVETFVQSIAASCACCLDIPISVT